MKMILVILATFIFFQCQELQAQNFDQMMHDGKRAYNNLEFSTAIKKFEAAKVECNRVNKGNCIEEVEEWLEKSEKAYIDVIKTARRKAIAERVAFAAQNTLNEGNITTAFRLAEFDYKFVDPSNPQVVQILLDSYYHNEDQRYQGKGELWSSHSLIGHQKEVLDVKFSSQGNLIATCSKDNTAKIWNSETGEVLHTLRGHNKQVEEVAFSADDKLLATCSLDGNVKIWDTHTGGFLRNLNKDIKNTVATTISFSPAYPHLLVCGYQDGEIILWDCIKGEKIRKITQHSSGLTSIAFAIKGDYLASADKTGKVIIWKSTENDLDTVFTKNVNQSVYSLDFSGSGEYIAAAITTPSQTNPYNVFVWTNPEGGDTIEFVAHGGVNTVDIDFNPKHDSLIATASFDDNAIIWDWSGAHPSASFTIKNHTNNVEAVEYSPNGEYLATASWDKTVKIWNLKSYQPKAINFGCDSTGRCAYHGDKVNKIAFNASRNLVATVSSDKLAAVWDVKNVSTPVSVFPHEDEVTGITFSPDGKWLATADRYAIYIWNTDQKGADPPLKKIPASYTLDVAFSPNGKLLAYTQAVGNSTVWEVEISGSSINVSDSVHLQSGENHFRNIAFSNDSKLLVTTNLEGLSSASHLNYSAQIWNAATGELIKVLKGHEGSVREAVFSNNDKYIATASEDGTAKVWEVETGFDIVTLVNHVSHVYSVAFSPNDSLLATGSRDNTVRVWDIQSGENLNVIDFAGDINDLQYLPDGSGLIVGMQYPETARIIYTDPKIILEDLLKSDRIAQLTPEDIKFFKLVESFENWTSENDITNRDETNLLLSSDDYTLILTFARYFKQQSVISNNQFESFITKAEVCYLRAKEINTNKTLDEEIAEMYRLWSEKLLLKNKFEEAAEEIQKAQEYLPKDVQVNKYLAHSCLLNGQTELATRIYLSLLTDHSQDFDLADLHEDFAIFNSFKVWGKDQSVRKNVESVLRVLNLSENLDDKEAKFFGLYPQQLNGTTLNQLIKTLKISDASLSTYTIDFEEYQRNEKLIAQLHEAEDHYIKGYYASAENTEKSIDEFILALSAYELLHEQETQNEEYLSKLTIISYFLSQLYVDQLNLAKTIEYNQLEIDWCKKLVNSNPANIEYKNDWLIPAYHTMSLYHICANENKEAYENAKHAFEIDKHSEETKIFYAISLLMYKGWDESNDYLVQLCSEKDNIHNQYFYNSLVQILEDAKVQNTEFDQMEFLALLYSKYDRIGNQDTSLIQLLGEEMKPNNDLTHFISILIDKERLIEKVIQLGNLEVINGMGEAFYFEVNRNFSKKDFDKTYHNNRYAIKLYEELYNMSSKETNYHLTLSNLLGGQAYYALFLEKYDDAIALTERGIKLNPNGTWMKTNMAHAHLFKDNSKKANSIYDDISEEPCISTGDTPCKQYIVEDFIALKNNGQCHDQFLEIALRLYNNELPENVNLHCMDL